MPGQSRFVGAFAKASSRVGMTLFLLSLGKMARGDCALTTTGKTSLNDLGGASYLGSPGGLYPDGSNSRPSAHEVAGLAIVQSDIKPRDAAGNIDLVNGKIVLVSIGMSNTTQEFATRGPGAFRPRANADPSKNPQLAIVDCAQGGHAIREWIDPANEVWSDCAQRLANMGLSPQQVQVAWVKLAERRSDVPDPSFPGHAVFTRDRLAQVLRITRTNFPNFGLAFLSSRTRSYENNQDSLSPEPFCYEEAFAVKWAIEQQIEGVGNLNFDSDIGPVVAPFLVWGPYLWTDGEVARSDGFTWSCSDLVADFTHPSEQGVWKVADQLIAQFKTDPLAAPWFLRGTIVGQPPSSIIQASTLQGAAPLTVQFDAVAADSDGMVVEFAWTFGDGGFSLSPSSVKSFLIPGTYAVRLTVTDNDGNSSSTVQFITVHAPAIPTLSIWGLVAMSVAIVIAAMLRLWRPSRFSRPCGYARAPVGVGNEHVSPARKRKR